jgi:hypothetical protein
MRGFVRCLSGGAAGCLLGGAMMVPLGATSTSQAVNPINSGAMRPLPSVTARPVVRDSMTWVPARQVPVPGEPTGVMVPGHWERRLPGTDEVHVPPLTIFRSTGTPVTVPAGIRPPVEERVSSP